MKIIEALKQIKDLARKRDDLREKAAKYCVKYDYEDDKYPDQEEQVKKWIQQALDINVTILQLRRNIQYTNLLISVYIEIGSNMILKSIYDWIQRRRDLADADRKVWQGLSDRDLQEQRYRDSSGDMIETKIVRYYDVKQRDIKIEDHINEKSIIDSRLEVVNAITDIIEVPTDA